MKGLRRKVWTQTKIWSINIRYFVAILGLVAIETLLKIFGKKSVVFFKVKNVLDEIFMTISVLAERLPTSATLTQDKLVALIWCRSGSSGIKNFQSQDFRDGILLPGWGRPGYHVISNTFATCSRRRKRRGRGEGDAVRRQVRIGPHWPATNLDWLQPPRHPAALRNAPKRKSASKTLSEPLVWSEHHANAMSAHNGSELTPISGPQSNQ